MEKRGDFSTDPAVLLDHAKFYSFFDLEREKKAVPFMGQFESLEAIMKLNQFRKPSLKRIVKS